MLDLEPLDGPFGLRVRGLDLAKPPTGVELDAIAEAFDASPLLVFPDQAAMPTEVQVQLVGRFARVLEERMPGDLHSFVSNDDGHGTDDKER